MRIKISIMLIVVIPLLACSRSHDGDRNFDLNIDRSSNDIIAALDAVAGDVGADSIAPFMARVKVRATHPDAQTVLLTIAGDTPAQDIHYTVTVSETGDKSAVHVETDIPASVGIEDGRLHKINGDGFASNLRNEFAGLAKSLETGAAPAKSAWSMKMAMHILGQSNRKSTQEDWAKVQADPQAYARQAGLDAGDRYIESQGLPPDQEERVKEMVHGALDHGNQNDPDTKDKAGWGTTN